MRKERKEAIYAAAERKQKILEWTIGTLIVGAATAIMVFVVYLIGLSRGSW